MAERARTAAVMLVIALTLGAGFGPGTVGGTPGEAGNVGDSSAVVDGPMAQQAGGCSFPVTVTDTTGTEVTVDSMPQRIVALQPSDIQILWAIGARDRVVGAQINQLTSYLNDTNGVTNVANEDGTINAERVVGLNPDLVLAANVTDPATIDQLRQAGIPVYAGGSPESIEGVYNTTERYGRLTGACAGANETVRTMEDRVTAIEEATSTTDQPRALYYFYEYTAGTGTFTADIVETAGARNVAETANVSGYQELNPEIVAQQNPEWIIYPSGASIPAGQPWSGTTALEQNQTLQLNANYVQQPGPRLVIPLTKIARTLHPEAMNRADLPPVSFADPSGASDGPNASGTGAPVVADGGNETVSASPTTVGSTTATNAATNGNGTETTGASGPGFGAIGAAIAVLAAGLFAARRN